MLHRVAVGFIMVLASIIAAPADTTPSCLFGADKVANAPRFESFTVPVETGVHPALPVLSSPDARLFRTMLRLAAAQGPNFAGHYTIAVWGCGTSCSDFAIINAKTGRVTFEEKLRAISTVFVDNAPAYIDNGPAANGAVDDNALEFRITSRLLILSGAPNGDEARDGVAYYEWLGTGLKLLRFVPAASACSRSLLFNHASPALTPPNYPGSPPA